MSLSKCSCRVTDYSSVVSSPWSVAITYGPRTTDDGQLGAERPLREAQREPGHAESQHHQHDSHRRRETVVELDYSLLEHRDREHALLRKRPQHQRHHVDPQIPAEA